LLAAAGGGTTLRKATLAQAWRRSVWLSGSAISPAKWSSNNRTFTRAGVAFVNAPCVAGVLRVARLAHKEAESGG
jgi:hypothetical protein